ncbi:MAG: polysaccharide deacetylase family protein [Verrucomicrobia bacterium]|nr:polysaccharide deacetylase family protein [Verrucomicrobiota bacterium]
MICLTGDVHHDSLKINEQLFVKNRNLSEVKISVDYARLCERYKIKSTLYVTGATLAEQWEEFKPIAGAALVEIGGHTYAGLPRSLASKIWAAVSGNISISHSQSHGSYASQRRDVDKMLAIAGKRLGRNLVSWRSHGLVHDQHTYRILAEAGIKYISDDLSWHKPFPELLPEGLISHPMNIIMDHDHIYHAHRTPEYVARQKRNWTFHDDPTKESYSIEEWGEIVTKQVVAIEQKGGLATVLMHPLCMYVADEFKTMEKLLKLFSQYKTIWACETGALVAKRKEANNE